MSKRALSVTLDPENILWLRGRTQATGRRSVSETLDRLVSEARSGGKDPSGIRSVVGSVTINESKGGLTTADEAIRAIFSASIERTARALLGDSRKAHRKASRPRAKSRV